LGHPVPGIPQIPGGRLLRQLGRSGLFLFHEGVGAARGHELVVTPEIDFYRSFIHLVLFLLCLYFGFFSKPKAPPAST
jgi:hypothetical protein